MTDRHSLATLPILQEEKRRNQADEQQDQEPHPPFHVSFLSDEGSGSAGDDLVPAGIMPAAGPWCEKIPVMAADFVFSEVGDLVRLPR